MKLSADRIAQFEAEGYLLLRGVLSDGDLDPIVAEYEEHIARRADELLVEGKVTTLYADELFNRRLVSICRNNNEIYKELDIMHFRGRASFEFLINDNLLDMIEALVGPEISCSPIQHTRAKLPSDILCGGDPHVVPWHQDAGVTWEEADPYFIFIVWLPLSPARLENGCLQIMPKAHESGLMRHYIKQGLGTVITDEELHVGEQLTLPPDKSDILFMMKETPHRSLENDSDTVRWSMDLRYQRTGTPTGRPWRPDFVARSKANPESELRDYDEWCSRWVAALEENRGKVIKSHRWEVVS